ILKQFPARGAGIVENHAAHLIEEEFDRDAPEGGEGLREPVHHRAHGLPGIEPEPEEARVAQHHEEGVSLPPREPEFGEVDLRLAPGGCLEADEGLRLGTGPGDRYVIADLGDATRVPRGLDLGEEAHRAERRIARESLGDDGLIGIELRGARWGAAPRCWRAQVSLELSTLDPVVDDAAADAQLSRDRRLGKLLIQQVFEKHEFVPSVHGASARSRRGATWGMGRRVAGYPAPHPGPGSGPSAQSSPVILCNFIPVLTSGAPDLLHVAAPRGQTTSGQPSIVESVGDYCLAGADSRGAAFDPPT